MATTGAGAPAATTAPTTTTSTLTPDTEWPRSDALDAQFLIQAGGSLRVFMPLYSQGETCANLFSIPSPSAGPMVS